MSRLCAFTAMYVAIPICMYIAIVQSYAHINKLKIYTDLYICDQA